MKRIVIGIFVFCMVTFFQMAICSADSEVQVEGILSLSPDGYILFGDDTYMTSASNFIKNGSGAQTADLNITGTGTFGSASATAFTASSGTSGFNGNGSGLTNVDAAQLGGHEASYFQPAGAYATLGANTFTANQTVTAHGINMYAGGIALAAIQELSRLSQEQQAVIVKLQDENRKQQAMLAQQLQQLEELAKQLKVMRIP